EVRPVNFRRSKQAVIMPVIESFCIFKLGPVDVHFVGGIYIETAAAAFSEVDAREVRDKQSLPRIDLESNGFYLFDRRDVLQGILMHIMGHLGVHDDTRRIEDVGISAERYIDEIECSAREFACGDDFLI